jgi:hypothetical protein
MCNFTIPFTGSAKDLLARAKKAITGAGGTFKGNTSKGSFQISSPVLIVGSYTVSGQNLDVKITKKPFFITCARIESELKKMIGSTAVSAVMANMAVSKQSHTDDILAHINAPHHVAARAASTKGCITLLDHLKICYSLSNDEVSVSAELVTPLGNVNLGSATLTPNNSSVTVGGHIAGFKAEVTISFDFHSLVLKVCGKVCVPIFGCTSGCTSVHL